MTLRPGEWTRLKEMFDAPSLNSLTGKTYGIPLVSGQTFPSIPTGGLQSDAEIARLPGAKAVEG